MRAYAFNAYDQDDLFQEISLQLWRSIPEFRGEAKASTWIYRVALYAASAWTRREQKQPPTEPLTTVAQTLTVMEQASNPRVDWLYEQIAKLEPIDRSICLLMFDGFSYKEMAEMLGISEIVHFSLSFISRYYDTEKNDPHDHHCFFGFCHNNGGFIDDDCR